MAVPQVKRLHIGFSLQRPAFIPRNCQGMIYGWSYSGADFPTVLRFNPIIYIVLMPTFLSHRV